jgi:hypothetical protein
MKPSLFASWAILVLAAAPSFGQSAARPGAHSQNNKPKFTVVPLKETDRIDRATMQSQAASGATIPFWNYSVVSPLDGKTYQGTMVGRSPFFNGHRATVVNTDIIPVKLMFADTGTLFDPTVYDNCLGDSVVNVEMQSPLFQNVNYTMNGVAVGSTQYTDAFQRANFWNHVAGTPYHTLFGSKVLSAVNVTVPAANGFTNADSFGCLYGKMDINWWESYLRTTIMPQLASQGVGPTVFPIFLFDAVFEYDGDPSQCCTLGYHSAYTTNNLLQTYSISSYDTSSAFGGDVSTTSHELAEWMDDPDTSNPTPLWGHVGQVSGCQGNLEVGDPLSPGYQTPTNPYTVTMPNGYTYTLQELAYFSWFFRQSPSVGSGGLYSDDFTFRSSQPALCQ